MTNYLGRQERPTPPSNPINQVRQAAAHISFQTFIPIRSATRREGIFSGRIREISALHLKLPKAEIATSPRRLGCQTLSPHVAPQVVADLRQRFSVDLLQRDATIADHVSRRLQIHCPQAVTIHPIAALIASDPFFNGLPVKRHRDKNAWPRDPRELEPTLCILCYEFPRE